MREFSFLCHSCKVLAGFSLDPFQMDTRQKPAGMTDVEWEKSILRETASPNHSIFISKEAS
jgi:hypothetical protein